MGWDIIIVVICVAIAAWFMGRRMYRVVKNSGGCACNCDKPGKGTCDGGRCDCSEHLREIQPDSKK